MHDEDREVKQVIVMRKDLKMRRGKEIAQGAHASSAFLEEYVANPKPYHKDREKVIRQWFEFGVKKVCVVVNSEKELVDIFKAARDARLLVNMITDSGHTEFHMQPTKTCLAIGPDYANEIDKITGDLTLY